MFREYIKVFFKYSTLLEELVIRDIKVRYQKSVLGLLWTVLNPLLMMVVITVVFSTVFRHSIPNFPIYYLTGSLIFSFNSESTSNAMYSIISNASLIKKVYI
ncbi:MAG TPA: ABC transporter permease, partial [Clostridia bacterium]|nr:ABC transporter permease [Clostridia bacterium]